MTLLLENLQNKLASGLGWYYMSITAVYMFFVIWLGFSRFGKIRLGPQDSQPDFSYRSWVGMLFSSGIGISLLYFGASEAIQHYLEPPNPSIFHDAVSPTPQLARQAVVLSFLHWGIHGWAMYALIAITLGYFAFRFNNPLTLRVAFYPLLGKKTDGLAGDLVDCFGIIVTVCGLISNLGIGTLQLRAGLTQLFGVAVNYQTLVTIMLVITVIATLIAIAGIEAGIQRIANINVMLFGLLLIFLLSTGPTLFLLNGFVQNIGDYLNQILVKTFEIYVYEPHSQQPWLSRWTIFYWAWWISWSPFVGLFIARISKGRTIREVVFGVLVIPLGFTLAWLSILGNVSLHDLFFGSGEIFQQLSASESISHPESMIYSLLTHYPAATFLITLTTIVGFILFLTPADSGAIMLANLSVHKQQGKDGPNWLRIFWSGIIFLMTAGLMYHGNIRGIQTTITLASLPFSIVMVIYMFLLLKQLSKEPTIQVSRISKDGIKSTEE